MRILPSFDPCHRLSVTAVDGVVLEVDLGTVGVNLGEQRPHAGEK